MSFKCLHIIVDTKSEAFLRMDKRTLGEREKRFSSEDHMTDANQNKPNTVKAFKNKVMLQKIKMEF